jgi:hypothetical protein
MPLKAQLVLGAMLLYIGLLARSAFRQGEGRQFAVSLGIVAGLLLVVVGLGWLWISLAERQGGG